MNITKETPKIFMDGIDVSEYIQYLGISQRTGYVPELHLGLKSIGRLLIKGSNKLTIQRYPDTKMILYYKDPRIEMTDTDYFDNMTINEFECILYVTKEIREVNYENN